MGPHFHPGQSEDACHVVTFPISTHVWSLRILHVGYMQGWRLYSFQLVEILVYSCFCHLCLILIADVNGSYFLGLENGFGCLSRWKDINNSFDFNCGIIRFVVFLDW